MQTSPIPGQRRQAIPVSDTGACVFMAEQTLIDHYKNSPHQGVVPQAGWKVHVRNRSCGDSLVLTAQIHPQGTIEDIRFEARGCFYCKVSASIACAVLAGSTTSEAKDLAASVRRWLAGKQDIGQDTRLRAVMPLEEVKQYPMRVACADLAWKGVQQLIQAYKADN